MSPTTELVPGQNVPAPPGVLDMRLQQPAGVDTDVVALLLQVNGKVATDHDFVFYNAPEHPSRSVTLGGAVLRIDPARVPAEVETVVVAAHRDAGSTLTGTSITVTTGEQTLYFFPQQVGGVGTAVLLEVYRRAGGWKIRAVGQGWSTGLEGLARDYGIKVNDEPEPDSVTLDSSGVHPTNTSRSALDQELANLLRQRQT